MKLTWKKVILVCVLVLLGYLMYTQYQSRSPVKMSKDKHKKSTVSTKSGSTPDSTSKPWNGTQEEKLKICMYNKCDDNEPYAYIDQYGFGLIGCIHKPYNDQNAVNVIDEQDPKYPTCKEFYDKSNKDTCKDAIENAMCGNLNLKQIAMSGDNQQCTGCLNNHKDLQGCKSPVRKGICNIPTEHYKKDSDDYHSGGIIHSSNGNIDDIIFNCLKKDQLKDLLKVTDFEEKDLAYLNKMPTCEKIHTDIEEDIVNANYYAYIADDGKARVLPEHTTKDLQSLHACRIAPYCRNDVTTDKWIKCVDNSNPFGKSVLLDCKEGKCTNGTASYAGSNDMGKWMYEYKKNNEPETCMSCDAVNTTYSQGKTLSSGLIFDVSDDGSFPKLPIDNGAVGKYDATKTRDQTKYLFNRCVTQCPKIDPCKLDATKDHLFYMEGVDNAETGPFKWDNDYLSVRLDAKCPNNGVCGTDLSLGVRYDMHDKIDWVTRCNVADNYNQSMCSDDYYFTTTTSNNVTETKITR